MTSTNPLIQTIMAIIKIFDFDIIIGRKGHHIRMTFIRWILLALGLMGICIMVYRLITGLGTVSNLSDDWPWGLWIYCDMFISAIGASGFAIGILTHVFHIKKFYPLAKQALLVSLMAYLLIFLILFIEIGRWDNFYYVFVSFAGWSPLYEVFVCLTLYFILQLIEVFELWCEHHGFGGKITKVVMAVITFVACIIPFGQEAALGAVYISMPGKMDALWQTQFLPWGCLMSAFFGGLSLITVVNNCMSRSYEIESDPEMTKSVIRIAAVFLWIYFVCKMVDLLIRGAFTNMFDGTTQGNMFLIEIIVGVILPGILAFTSVNNHREGQVCIAILTIVGIMINRVNFMFVGLSEHVGYAYFPSLLEFLLVFGLCCLACFLYVILIENLPVMKGKNDKTYRVVELPKYKA